MAEPHYVVIEVAGTLLIHRLHGRSRDGDLVVSLYGQAARTRRTVPVEQVVVSGPAWRCDQAIAEAKAAWSERQSELQLCQHKVEAAQAALKAKQAGIRHEALSRARGEWTPELLPSDEFAAGQA